VRPTTSAREISERGKSLLKTHKITAASLLSLATAGALVAASTTGAGAAPAVHRAPSIHIADPNAKLTPNKNLVPGQTVTITVHNFPGADSADHNDVGQPMYVFQCAAQALSTNDQSYCDVHPEDGNNTQTFTTDPNDANKAAGTSTYTIRAGSAFRAANPKAKCGFSPKAGSTSSTCFVVVADEQTQSDNTSVGFAQFTFKDNRGTSTTKIKAPKTLKAGKTLKAKITVKGSHSGSVAGKVIVTDKGKKIAKKNVSSSGVLKVKEKHAKKGKHKLVAKYAGNNSFKSSSGKATVKVKK
jgi:Bacterial Ig-like domain (group 3)